MKARLRSRMKRTACRAPGVGPLERTTQTNGAQQLEVVVLKRQHHELSAKVGDRPCFPGAAGRVPTRRPGPGGAKKGADSGAGGRVGEYWGTGELNPHLKVLLKNTTMARAVQWLREHDIRYILIFPARLRVQHETKVLFFETPRAATDWMESIGLKQILPNWNLNGSPKKDVRRAENRRTPSFQQHPERGEESMGKIVVSEDGTLRSEPNHLTTINPFSPLTLT
ncbi:hypothetical protein NDU88_001976 [Pleurodeles waltl]|uniref:Uncharacterized protein n=1 Tax=Pleurodeles waltl TaxID=8319 RepID=A0AAV7WJY4_PLEWA|nr:hypothetical protein NDU88_001976 [Pleurodeles waltl]